MPTTETTVQAQPGALRLWPAIVIAVIVLVLRVIVPRLVVDTVIYGVLASAAGFVLILVWWLFFSKAPRRERLAALGLMVVAVAATRFLVDRSIANGMMGNMVYAYAVPATLPLFFVGWAVVRHRLAPASRYGAMALAIFAGCLVWTLVRTEGVLGGGESQLAWRWSPTAEDRLLAQVQDAPSLPSPAPPVEPVPAPTAAKLEPVAPPPAASAALKPAAAIDTPVAADPDPRPAPWPGFRGPERDSVVHGVTIETDWTTSPPQELWRRPIGPGWSSFAVRGNVIYTQEQRGESEVVAAYAIRTGKPVWVHKDPIRFWESNGGRVRGRRRRSTALASTRSVRPGC